MTRFVVKSVLRCLAGLTVLSCASMALAQGGGGVLAWKWNQPWTRPRASFVSLVRDCQGTPVTFGPIAMDDFECQQTGPIVRISWWGTSQIPTAPARNFFFRIYQGTPGACVPGNTLWQACAQASVKHIAQDCQGRRVWYYTATFPNPFTQTQGQRYWLQISEVDGVAGGPSSPVIGAPDFRWSGHRPIVQCAALQRNAAGGITQPLIDPCDQQADDLSFRLYSRTISGTIIPSPTGRPAVHRLCLRDPDTLELLEVFEVSPDPQGNFYIFSELPERRVRIYLNGMANVEEDLGTLNLENSADYDLGVIRPACGDVDGDDEIDFGDITKVLSAFGRRGATTP